MPRLEIGPAVRVVAQRHAEQRRNHAHAVTAGDGRDVVLLGSIPLRDFGKGAAQLAAHGDQCPAAVLRIGVPALGELHAAAHVIPTRLEAQHQSQRRFGAVGGFAAGGGGNGNPASKLPLRGALIHLDASMAGGGVSSHFKLKR